MNDGFVRVASLRQIADGEMLAVEIGEHEILLARLGDTVHAVGNVCSHAEVWLDDGTLHRESCEIECSMHEGRFDLRTGEATHEPCVDAIPSYPVRIEGDDVLVAI